MGLFGRLFSDLKSPHPRFGSLLLLMMVNRPTIQIHFTEAPGYPEVPPVAEQQGHISGLSLECGRGGVLKQQQATIENNIKITKITPATNQPTASPAKLIDSNEELKPKKAENRRGESLVSKRQD